MENLRKQIPWYFIPTVVIVAGCLVQRHRAKMLEWAPGIDAMVGVFDRDKIEITGHSGKILGVPIAESYRGVMPFLASDVVRLVLLFLFPPISLWLVKYVG